MRGGTTVHALLEPFWVVMMILMLLGAGLVLGGVR